MSRTHRRAGHLKTIWLFVSTSTLSTQLTEVLGSRGASAAAMNHWQAVGAHAEVQQDMHAPSTERLHRQVAWPAQVPRLSKPPVGCTQSGTGRRACARAGVEPLSGLTCRDIQELEQGKEVARAEQHQEQCSHTQACALPGIMCHLLLFDMVSNRAQSLTELGRKEQR